MAKKETSNARKKKSQGQGKRKPKSTKKKNFVRRLKDFFKNERQRKKVIFFSVLIGSFLWLFWGIPLPTKLTSRDFPVSTKLYDRNEKLIFEIYTDKRSTPVKLDELPDQCNSINNRDRR